MKQNYDLSHWIGILFNCRKHAGLRGDDCLWEELEQTLATRIKPASIGEFNELLLEVMEELGIDLESPDDRQWIDRYPNNGMSAGYIHLDTWRTKNIPLLKERFAMQLAEKS